MTSTAFSLSRRIESEIKKLSLRERMLVVAAIGGVVVFLVFHAVTALREKFAEQTVEIERVEALRQEVLGNSEGSREAGILARYLELRARKSALEAQFKEVEVKDGVRSYLEEKLRTKAGVSERYDIKDAPTRPFGTEYELAPFTVKFTAMNMQGTVDFLRELVHGPHPLVLTDLDLRKGRMGDKLDVAVEVLSIRKVK